MNRQAMLRWSSSGLGLQVVILPTGVRISVNAAGHQPIAQLVARLLGVQEVVRSNRTRLTNNLPRWRDSGWKLLPSKRLFDSGTGSQIGSFGVAEPKRCGTWL